MAYGLRNPFRFTQRPGTDELWVGDVGWNTWEEINRVVAPDRHASNFGWPCYEGASAQGGYQGAGLNLCSSLYSTPGSVVAPYYTYNHGACVVNYSGCHTGGSSVTGVAFYQGGSYPAQYNGALFFGDHTRNEIWAMLPGTNGLPDPARLQSFVGVDGTGGAAGHPVDLKIGPGGDLFYVDMDDGTVHRITYTAANQPPTAVITANPTNGPAPLTVSFDGTGSVRPGGQAAELLVGSQRRRHVRRRHGLDRLVHLHHGGRAITRACGSPTTRARATRRRSPSRPATPRRPRSSTRPSSSLTWKVGDTINFSGHATDAQDGTLPASALSWSLILHHCFTPTDCHTHLIQTIDGVASGSVTAPDHEYPCWLELQLTATDSGGLDLDHERPAEPEDGGAHVQDQPGRPRPQRPGGQRGAAHHAVRRDRGRRLGELGQRPVATAVQQIHLQLHFVVGRRPAEPHHHRARGEHDVHRDLSQAMRLPGYGRGHAACGHGVGCAFRRAG